MADLSNSKILLTGASRGIGAVLADALAARGADLLLVARSEPDLEEVRARVAKRGTRVLTLSVDLGDHRALERLVEVARRDLGEIDVLVNNAGIEQMGFYEDLTSAEIERSIALNLATPMLLTRLVLPDMLARDRGHILNVASIAGLGATAFGEAYGATKHGLVGFTRSLRASLKARGSAVSASVLCPGFVAGTGMYQEVHERYGVVAPWRLGTSAPAGVARAALRAIERDEPELIVNRTPLRHLIALGAALPRTVERVTRAFDVNAASRELAERRRAERHAEANGGAGARTTA